MASDGGFRGNSSKRGFDSSELEEEAIMILFGEKSPTS